MSERTQIETWIRDELIQLLAASATLAGLCVTVVALMNTLAKSTSAATIADDLFAVCALLFLACIYFIFSALRTRTPALARTLVNLVDVVFLLALTLMTAASFVMVYTVW